MNPVDRQSIEHFVRTTLGCKCPDEVFESIAIERAPTPYAALPYTRLVIGDRLLIYIHETQPAEATTATVSRLAQQGLSERDAKQYNRYRLVIVSAHPTQVLDDARTSFASVVGNDQRAHLHVLATDQLPDALRVAISANRSDLETALPAPVELPHWLRGDPIALHLRSLGRPVTKAAWLECAYGSSNEVVLEQDKETRVWIRSHFPSDPDEAVG
jgi:hypothetical protein